MKIPVIQGVIDRRLLINYRVDPEIIAALLPPPFRPQTVGPYAIAGICLIRLKQIRPRWLPAMAGISSENAAHRIAVEWDESGTTRCGVYVPRRDTSSRLNAYAGGRLFPGVHHLADFESNETETCYRVEMNSRDGRSRLQVEAEVTDDLPAESVFGSVAEVSDFFRQGSLGYSPNERQGVLDGLELRTFDWQVTPLSVHAVTSSFFENRDQFPEGSVTFDNALLMREIRHQWLEKDSLPMEGEPSVIATAQSDHLSC